MGRVTAPEAKKQRRTRNRGAGEGSIRFNATRQLWQAEIMTGTKPDGSRIMRYVASKARGECQAQLGDIRRRHSDGSLGAAAKEREAIGQSLDRWLATTRTTVRPKTFETYVAIAHVHLTPGLGRHKLSALKSDHVQALYVSKLAAGSSPQTVVHLHRARGQAVRWGYTVRNVCERWTRRPCRATRSRRPAGRDHPAH